MAAPSHREEREREELTAASDNWQMINGWMEREGLL